MTFKQLELAPFHASDFCIGDIRIVKGTVRIVEGRPELSGKVVASRMSRLMNGYGELSSTRRHIALRVPQSSHGMCRKLTLGRFRLGTCAESRSILEACNQVPSGRPSTVFEIKRGQLECFSPGGFTRPFARGRHDKAVALHVVHCQKCIALALRVATAGRAGPPRRISQARGDHRRNVVEASCRRGRHNYRSMRTAGKILRFETARRACQGWGFAGIAARADWPVPPLYLFVRRQLAEGSPETPCLDEAWTR
jgi:hypothetical protein